jgi:hypothetical protein
VAAYLACRTQWNYAPSGAPTGLRYADCMALLRAQRAALGISKDDMQDAIDGLQVIERAFVQARAEVWQEQRSPDE